MKPPWHEHDHWQNPITSIESAGGFALLRNALNAAKSAGDSDATLEMDPHPGSIGGRVAGTITLPRNTKAIANFILRLSCVSNFAPDQSDYPDGRFAILWAQELNTTPSNTRDGIKVTFVFDHVPANLPESELPLSGGYVDWQLTLTASADVAELCHTFSIPVFATEMYSERPARSASATDSILSEWRVQKTWQPYRAEIAVETDTLVVRHGPWRGGLYQAGGLKGFFAFFLLLLLSVVLLISGNEELVSTVVTGVFGTLGLFVTGLAGYLWVRTVEIRVQPGQLFRYCRIFGRTVQTRILSANNISAVIVRDAELYVVSNEFGELQLIDSIYDLELLNALRRLVVDFLRPVSTTI
ncbi:MAG: hypothetical protein WBM76_15590 [Woeseiaceae bacterium]